MNLVRFTLRLLVGITLAFSLCFCSQTVSAQLLAESEIQILPREKSPWYHVAVDKILLQKMESVLNLEKENKPLEAAAVIQTIVDHEADYFIDTKKRVSAKRFLVSWIEQRDRDALNAYEVLYGAIANNHLEQFESAGNRTSLTVAAQKYLHTTAGKQAAYRLACLNYVEGKFLAAAVQFEQLLELKKLPPSIVKWAAIKNAHCWLLLGRESAASQILKTQFANSSSTRILIAGKSFTATELLEQLKTQTVHPLKSKEIYSTQWAQFRQSARRKKTSLEFNPLPMVQWEVDLLTHLLPEKLPRKKFVQNLLQDIIQELQRDDVTTLPAWNPIQTGNQIFVSGFGTVAAFSLQDGKLLWKSSTQDQVLAYLQSEEILEKLMSSQLRGGNVYIDYLVQQIAADLTTGMLSSDGKRVFAIRECGLVSAISTKGTRSQETLSTLPGSANRLSAFDARTGQLLWEAGGLFGGAEQDYADHFFLGPPVVVKKNTFVLTENGGQIFLSQFDPQTGRALWMQPLVLPESEIKIDQPRRLAGSSLTFCDPFFICTTNTGTVVTYDLQAKQLRWLYVYRTPNRNREEASPFRRRQRFPDNSPRMVNMYSGSRWQDSISLATDNYVLLTPVDSQDLLCLDILTGKLLWSEPRKDGMYIELHDEDQLLIIGRHTLRSVNLQDGNTKWIKPISQSAPSGRGVFRGNVYQLPTWKDGLHSYDLKTGALLATTAPNSRSGFQPGNLIVAHDQLITVRNARLTALQPLHRVQKKIDDQLQNKPRDAVALFHSGLLSLHRGETQTGLSLLQRSYRINKSPATAQQITKTILNADTNQIVLSEQNIVELAKMMVGAEHSTEILLRYVQALLQHSKLEESISVLHQLMNSKTRSQQYLMLPDGRRVRTDAAVAGIMQDIYTDMNHQQRQVIQNQTTQQITQAKQYEQLLALKPFAVSKPLAVLFRLQMARKLSEQNDPLELEKNLLWLKRNSTKKHQAEATARLAHLLLIQNKPLEATVYLSEMESAFAHTNCLHQTTGKQLIKQWKNEFQLEQTDQLSKLLNTEFTTTFDPDATAIKYLHFLDSPREIECHHSSPSTWQHWSFQISPTEKPTLTANNSQQQKMWSAALPETIKSLQNCSLQSEGHFALFCSEGEFSGINGFTRGENNDPLLWNENFRNDPAIEQAIKSAFLPTLASNILGPTPLMISWGEEVGQLAHCYDQKLAYRIGQKVYLKDATTGNSIWEYQIESNRPAVVWNDGIGIYIIHPQDRTVLPLRLEDGQPGQATEMPAHQRLLALQGSIAVLWHKLDSKQGLLIGYHLASRKRAWQIEVSASISIAEAGNGIFAVHDHNLHQILLIKPQKNDPVICQLSVPEITASELFIVSDSHHWYIHFTNQADQNSQPVANYSNQITNGPVIAIDKKTKQIIWTQHLKQLRWIPMQPVASPLLIYGSQAVHRKIDENGERQLSYHPTIKIIHKKTGKVLVEKSEGIFGKLESMKFSFTTKESAKQENKPTSVLQFKTGKITVTKKPRK